MVHWSWSIDDFLYRAMLWCFAGGGACCLIKKKEEASAAYWGGLRCFLHWWQKYFTFRWSHMSGSRQIPHKWRSAKCLQIPSFRHLPQKRCSLPWLQIPSGRFCFECLRSYARLLRFLEQLLHVSHTSLRLMNWDIFCTFRQQLHLRESAMIMCTYVLWWYNGFTMV